MYISVHTNSIHHDPKTVSTIGLGNTYADRYGRKRDIRSNMSTIDTYHTLHHYKGIQWEGTKLMVSFHDMGKGAHETVIP